jgi:hypothetical protein
MAVVDVLPAAEKEATVSAAVVSEVAVQAAWAAVLASPQGSPLRQRWWVE